MPRFNTSNPTNIGGKALEMPEDFLFRTVREMLCEGGYHQLTFDLLAQKNCDIGLLRQYDTMDDLIEAVIDDLTERLRIIWDVVTAQAREYLKSGNTDRDQSIRQLERLIYRHTYQVLHPKNRSYVLLCCTENLIPKPFRERVAAALHENFTSVLTQMIIAASEVENSRNAAILASQVVGNINFYVLQPELTKVLFNDATGLDPNMSEIEDYMNNMLLRSIWWNTSINKTF